MKFVKFHFRDFEKKIVKFSIIYKIRQITFWDLEKIVKLKWGRTFTIFPSFFNFDDFFTAEQNVTLPTSKAVIDAAASTDDYNVAKDLKFKWEIISSPLGFQQELQDLPTITLENLVVGNYR